MGPKSTFWCTIASLRPAFNPNRDLEREPILLCIFEILWQNSFIFVSSMDYVIIRWDTEFEGKRTRQILYSIGDEMHDWLFETSFQIQIATYHRRYRQFPALASNLQKAQWCCSWKTTLCSLFRFHSGRWCDLKARFGARSAVWGQLSIQIAT